MVLLLYLQGGKGHGIWKCKNGVIQVYEVMKKQLINNSLEQLIIRPYKPKDAEVEEPDHFYPITAVDLMKFL